jgi:quercetin dioxygenase-like cupin family protein
MKITKLADMRLGWFIGDFEPVVHRTSDFEASVKYFKIGESEPRHYQRVATEITVIITGTAKIENYMLGPGDIITIEPNEPADFIAITDVALIAIKFPSIPSDKVLS